MPRTCLEKAEANTDKTRTLCTKMQQGPAGSIGASPRKSARKWLREADLN